MRCGRRAYHNWDIVTFCVYVYVQKAIYIYTTIASVILINRITFFFLPFNNRRRRSIKIQWVANFIFLRHIFFFHFLFTFDECTHTHRTFGAYNAIEGILARARAAVEKLCPGVRPLWTRTNSQRSSIVTQLVRARDRQGPKPKFVRRARSLYLFAYMHLCVCFFLSRLSLWWLRAPRASLKLN